MAFNKAADREGAPMKRRPMHRRKKVCVFCGKDNVIDYKDTNKLKRYISERGKILPPYHRKLCKAPESSYSSNQESTSRSSYAIRLRISLGKSRLPGFGKSDLTQHLTRKKQERPIILG